MKEGVAMDNTHLTSGGPEGGEFLAASRGESITSSNLWPPP